MLVLLHPSPTMDIGFCNFCQCHREKDSLNLHLFITTTEDFLFYEQCYFVYLKMFS